MADTNPNGANQHTPDIREQQCWDFYVESVIAGIPNAYESAIKAGYEESSAKNITLRGWFKERLENLERRDMLSKAEKKLAKTLTYKVENEKGEVKTDLLRIQVDVSKHLTNTLGKDKGYSTKGEDATDKLADTLKTIVINKQYGSDNKLTT
jgi:phage terminase small subunit